MQIRSNLQLSPKSGVFVPGITEEEPGSEPEPDKPWKAGHDFENPPQPEYKLSPIPMRPLLSGEASIEMGSRRNCPMGRHGNQ